MEVKDEYGRTAEQIERDERLTEKLRPLMNRFLVFINFVYRMKTFSLI